MPIYFILFIALLIGGGISLIENEAARTRAYQFYLIAITPCLWLFATLRGSHVDHDYQTYLSWFHDLTYGIASQGSLSKDPAFAIIGKTVHALGFNYVAVAGVYAALCLIGQILIVRRVVPPRWIALGLFLVLTRFFMTHEMTQIRTGVAIPFGTIALLDAIERRFLRALALFFLGICFHAAILLMIPVGIAVVCRVEFRSRWWIGALLPFALLIKLMFSNVVMLLGFFARSDVYISGLYSTESVNLISVFFILQTAFVSIVMLLLWDKLSLFARTIVFCSATGLFFHLALSSNDALALRASDVFGIFEIVAFLVIFPYLSSRAILTYALLLLMLGGIFFRSSTKILEPYETAVFSSTYISVE